MATDVLVNNVLSARAYSEGGARFDLEPPPMRARGSTPNSAMVKSEIEPSEEVKVNPDICPKSSPPQAWEIDVRQLISTTKWLQTYGLRKNRLDMKGLLPLIGFRHADDYDPAIKKPICSRYGESMFQRFFRNDGRSYNLSCTKDQLRQVEARLCQAISLYKRRLEWLTTESRRIFGVMEEKVAVLVLDIRNLSPQQFDQYRAAVERLLREQASQLAKFNVIRATEDLVMYRSECVAVTQDSVDEAVDWLWSLDRCDGVSRTASAEAVLKALSDNQTEAVYLITEGSSCDGSRELLREKLVGVRVPVHVVSYNCTDATMVVCLKELARITGARFHAYAVIMEMDSYEGLPVDPATSQANIILKKKTYGGVPSGAGSRDDVIKLFEELEEARNNLAQIQGLIEDFSETKNSYELQRQVEDSERTHVSETYMSSREWIERHGLKAKKLGFYDVLGGVAFKHQDGVVDLRQAPNYLNNEYQTDAVRREKLVNAKYCDKFPHVRWKDGQVYHVQVTPEVHRRYVASMRLALEFIQQRIDWLQQGSRELFGTVIENQIYFLIDTSASMQSNIQFVKDKLFSLMQEQLRHKQKFNLVAFDSKAYPWKDRLMEVNEKNLQSAWQWVKALECKGSTNTLAALRVALADKNTEAIYLLTDGRPDQPPKSVLAQVYLHPKVPIHTISFNCRDSDANEFLCQLAQDTHARFHYYHENGLDLDGPDPWESEDIRLLRQELEIGAQNLQKIGQLRDECAALAWTGADGEMKCSRNHHLSRTDRVSAVPALDPKDLFRPNRPSSATFRQPAPPSARPTSARIYSSTKARTVTRRPMSAKLPRTQPIVPRPTGNTAEGSLSAASASLLNSIGVGQPIPRIAGHTHTSILRMLSSGANPGSTSSWLLPETRKLFDDQLNRLQKRKEMEAKKNKKKPKKKPKKIPLDSESMSSRRWLLYHGLAALKLRILDVLAPTFIPQRPKHVPILNKNVVSKVFDDVLPISHVADKSQIMHVINPQAVDLEGYIKKVEAAIFRYHERLNRIVWDGLPEDEREKFESEGPVKYMDHKTKLMTALDRAAWPVSETDIILLEREIQQAELYIQQARDLMAQKAEPEPETNEEVATPKKQLLPVNGLIGCTVIARHPFDGFFYPGKVDDVYNIRKVSVKFDRLERHDVATRLVIPITGAIARPHIMMGDYVLTKVVNDESGFECYVPGIIYMLPKCSEKTDHCHCKVKFYTVILFNGQKAEFMRNHLVKISKMRYLLLCKYIWELKPEDRPEPIVKEKIVKEYIEVPITEDLSDERGRLEEWRRQLEKQYRIQKHEQENLREQAKKLAHLRGHLESAHETHSEEQRQVMESLLHDMNHRHQERYTPRNDGHHHHHHHDHGHHHHHHHDDDYEEDALPQSRTTEWVVGHHGSTHGSQSREILDEARDKTVVVAHDDAKPIPPLMLEVRRTSPPLKEGDEVLARWSDEGWYYRGIVRQDCGDYSYIVEDSVGDLEKIWREDVIHDDDDRDKPLKKKDAVVALHPQYTFSYAPAVVLGMSRSGDTATVRFYDGVETDLVREDMYKVMAEKFELDVAYIVERERQWVGQAVVARDDRTGEYGLALVKQQMDTGKEYQIEWADGNATTQMSCYMFGAFTKKHPLAIGDHVLAIANEKSLKYLPGRIIKSTNNRTTLQIEFCNGKTVKDCNPEQCFWLSAEFYQKAAKFYSTKGGGHSSDS